MTDPFEVFLLDDCLIVEVSEDVTRPAPGLELHVTRDDDAGRCEARWVLDDGRVLVWVPVADSEPRFRCTPSRRNLAGQWANSSGH